MFTNMIRMIAVIVLFGLAGQSALAQETDGKDKMMLALQEQGSEISTIDNLLLDRVIELNIVNETVEVALASIAEELDLKLMYTKELLPKEMRVNIVNKRMTLYDALWQVLNGTGLQFAISSNRQLVVVKQENSNEKAVSEIVQETISGRIFDSESEEALPTVNIVVKNTNNGTTTNLDGEFELTVESLQDTLVVSFVGYQTREVPINGRTTDIDIALQQQALVGDEIIVTGYSTQRRADITGSVSTVSIDNISQQSTVSAINRLDGKVSGVTVESGGTPGGRNTVRIRGISSFQNNDPLYVVDGVPVQDSFMNFLNPNDIAEMQVLKDASAASIYGARASNGVVIIETKKGQSGRPQIALDIKLGRATPAHQLDNIVITDPLQYAEVVKRDVGSEFPTHLYGDPENPSIPGYLWPTDQVNQTNDLQAQFGITEDDYSWYDNIITPASTGTNWFDELYDPALSQEYNLGISGGGDNNQYHISFNFLDQEGTTAWNRFKRGTIRVNTQFEFGGLTIGENLGVSLDEHYGGAYFDNLGEGGVAGRANLVRPIIPVYDVSGVHFAGTGRTQRLSDGVNPLKIAWGDKDDIYNNNRIFGNVFARYDFNETVLLNSSLGFNLGETSSRSFSPSSPEGNNPTFSDNFSEGMDQFIDWTFTNTLNYLETISEQHNIDLLAGTEFRQSTARFLNGTIGDLLTTDINARFIQDSLGDPDQIRASSGGSTNTLVSFFGKVNYNFDNRYYLDFTLRRDGSSRFGSNNRWGTFPAASIGWRVSNESFLNDSETLSNLMIRFGWGVTGNEDIPSGRLFDLYGGGTGDTFYDIYGTDNSLVKGFRQTSLGNPNMRWEENETINLGLDAEFFEGSFYFAVDIYERSTNDLLFDPSTAATAGSAAPPIVNVGKMENRGIDLEVGYSSQLSTDLSYNISLTGGHYSNEIVKIDGQAEQFFGPVSARFGTPVINKLGHSIGSFYGYIEDGIFQNQSEVDAHADQEGAAPGRLRFRDVNGDGAITIADRTVMGDPHPDFTGGLNFSVNYKNWDLNTSLTASIGNEIFDIQKEYYVFRLFEQNVRKDLLDKSAIVENGQVVNPGAEYPQIDASDTFSQQYSSFYVEDGSYLRMRNITIGYTLPTDGMFSIFQSVRFYAQTENLFTITGYSGLDPVLPPISNSGPAGDIRDQARGLDRGSIPSRRTITIGANINF